ncbi:MAG: hypothetical protein IPJ85_01860 [Flavobacteriales bacterium]|nr:hypothetical protein [Flavobacteriales bacterium]
MKNLPLLLALVLTAAACGKCGDCPDPNLRAKHKNDFCTEDCPGVCGCDGRTYCNECMARREGVRVVGQGEC